MPASRPRYFRKTTCKASSSTLPVLAKHTPIRSENRALLVASIARGRRWLDELITDPAANTETIAAREGWSVRRGNMMISIAFLAPDLVKAAIDGRLPHGMGVVRLSDMPAEWFRQHLMLGFSIAQTCRPHYAGTVGLPEFIDASRYVVSRPHTPNTFGTSCWRWGVCDGAFPPSLSGPVPCRCPCRPWPPQARRGSRAAPWRPQAPSHGRRRSRQVPSASKSPAEACRRW
jgi:hypothetical protein